MLVTVTNAPVTVDLVSLLRPVVRTALFGRSLINEVPSADLQGYRAHAVSCGCNDAMVQSWLV
jgi:hypothetical protein